METRDCMAFLRAPLDDLVGLGHKNGIYAVTQNTLLDYLHLNRLLLRNVDQCKNADTNQVDEPEPPLVDSGFHRKQP